MRIEDYKGLKGAKNLEDILCLSVLVAMDKLRPDVTITEADEYHTRLDDCSQCPFIDKCLACIINE